MIKLDNINQAVKLAIKYVKNPSKEHCICVYVNSDLQVKGVELISVGSSTSTIIEAREIFRPALFYNAIGLVILHNHPSGNIKPSKEDREIFKMLKRCGEILHINVADSLVFNMNGLYYSINLRKIFSYISK